MAIASLNLYSRALNMDTCVEVLLPERRLEWPEPRKGKTYPVLYLLHGHCQDHTGWLKNSRIAWYLRNQEIITVFPNGDRANYVDGVLTHRYQTYLSEELPLILKNWLPISERPEDTYIGGMSMGGYGALHEGLTRPEQYGGVIAMAPAISMYDIEDTPEMRAKGGPPLDDEDANNNLQAIFGGRESFNNSAYNLYHCLEEFRAHQGHKPKIYMCCGQDDFLLEQCQAFAKRAMEQPGVDLTLDVSPGMHNWDFWDREIVTALKFFGLLPEEFERL